MCYCYYTTSCYVMDYHLLFQIAKNSYILHTKLLIASKSYYVNSNKYAQSINDHFQKAHVSDGKIEYRVEGKIHGMGDSPAIIYANGTRKWYKYGCKYRHGDLPADIYSDNTCIWYKHGKIHRDNDLPAIVQSNGVLKWYKHGIKHRDNDLPAVIYSNGNRKWYKKDVLHRSNDLPAIINFDSTIVWYKHGEKHRSNDLPAAIRGDGKFTWYKNGSQYRHDHKLPTSIHINGTRKWSRKDVIYCNLPTIIFSNGICVLDKYDEPNFPFIIVDAKFI